MARRAALGLARTVPRRATLPGGASWCGNDIAGAVGEFDEIRRRLDESNGDS
jgi:hypothetical protein